MKKILSCYPVSYPVIRFKKLIFVSGFFMHSNFSCANLGCSINENRSRLSQTYNNCGNRWHSRHEYGSKSCEKNPHKETYSNSLSSPFSQFEISSLRVTVKIIATRNDFYNTIFFSRTVRTDFVQNRIEETKNMKDVYIRYLSKYFSLLSYYFLLHNIRVHNITLRGQYNKPLVSSS